jgi:hypothetical protein
LGRSVFPTPTPQPLTLLLPPVVTQPPTPTTRSVFPAPTPVLEALEGPLTVGLDAALPEAWASALLARLNQTGEAPTANGPQPLRVLDQPSLAASLVTLRPYTQATAPLAERIFAVAAPFATIRDDITLAELTAAWQSGAPVLYATVDTAALLRPILGDFAGTLTTDAELLTALESTPGALAVLPFDQLDPRVKVLTIDGANVLSNQFNVLTYPLAVALSVEGAGATAFARWCRMWCSRTPTATRRG